MWKEAVMVLKHYSSGGTDQSNEKLQSTATVRAET
jgi:hypothetical protein